jgi:hypothetical protein
MGHEVVVQLPTYYQSMFLMSGLRCQILTEQYTEFQQPMAIRAEGE